MNTSKLQERVISVVCQELNVQPSDLFTYNRKKIVSLARHFCIYIMRVRTGLSYEDLGRIFHKNGKPMDHTSTRHSFITVQGWLDIGDESVCIQFAKIMEIVNSGSSKEVSRPNKLVISFDPGYSINKVISILKSNFSSLEYELTSLN